MVSFGFQTLHVKVLLVNMKTQHPGGFFFYVGDHLQCVDYYCTLCPLMFPTYSNPTGPYLVNEGAIIPCLSCHDQNTVNST